MRCPACGEEVVAAAVYCHKCGHRLDPDGDGDPAPPSAGPSTSAGAFQQVAAARWEDKDKPEEVLWRGGYSAKAMAGGWAFSGGLSIVLLLFGLFIMPWKAIYWLVILVAILLPWIYCLAVSTYRRMSVHYVLSTQRFIHERGFLRRVNDRIELLDVDDITYEQTLSERLAGVGTLRIMSHDRSDPELVLSGIDDIKRVAGLFDDARLAERRRRGLHVEQI